MNREDLFLSSNAFYTELGVSSAQESGDEDFLSAFFSNPYTPFYPRVVVSVNPELNACSKVMDSLLFDSEGGRAVAQECQFAEYVCDTCKHFTGNEKKPYHCRPCGTCRIHKDRSFHCDACKVCLDEQLKNSHKCRPESAHDKCCICLKTRNCKEEECAGTRTEDEEEACTCAGASIGSIREEHGNNSGSSGSTGNNNTPLLKFAEELKDDSVSKKDCEKKMKDCIPDVL